MARQNISTGSAANDGTGDTLRGAATKINDNFIELYTAVGRDSTVLSSKVALDSAGIAFTSDSGYTTVLSFFNPDSAGRLINLPDKNGTVTVIEGDVYGDLVDLANSATGTAARILFGNTYDSVGVFPDVTVYDGLFVEDGATGKAYFSNGSSYVKLLDSDLLATGSYSLVTDATLTGLTLESPVINSTITDSAGSEILQLTTSGTPDNYLKITAENSTAGPTIGADGSSTDVGITLLPKNSGVLEFGGRMKYASQLLDSTGAIFDSDKAMYIIDVSTSTSFNWVGQDFEMGEIKKIVNKSGANVVTLQLASGNLAHPDAGLDRIILEGNSFFEMVFDGDRWNLDRDSDRQITIA